MSFFQKPIETGAPIRFSKAAGIPYLILAILFAAVAWLHLASLFVIILFSIFVLRLLCFKKQRALALVLFLIVIVATFTGFGLFIHRAIKEVPGIMDKVIPILVQSAERYDINVPVTDWSDFKEEALKLVKQSLGELGKFAKLATREFVILVAGIVIASSLFLSRPMDKALQQTNLYTHYDIAIRECFISFYRNFEAVMGAQFIISLINTTATAVFVLSTSLWPYAGLLIPFTFICGMLPIIGNLISNTLIVSIAFGLVSPQLAFWALAFLIVIHKLEYFFNSKIIGTYIRHPMWLTLIALIFGEYCMGIPGVILAPVILSFIKVECSRYNAPALASVTAPVLGLQETEAPAPAAPSDSLDSTAPRVGTPE